MKNKNFKLAIFYVILIAAVIAAIFFLLNDSGEADKIVYSDLVELFSEEKVKTFEIDGKNNITIIEWGENGQDGKVHTYKLRDFAVFYNDFTEIIKKQVAEGKIESYEYVPIKATPWWVSALPIIIIIIFFAILWIVMMREATGGKGSKIGSFAKSKAKLDQNDEKKRVTFNDVAGADEEKEELTEIVEFLKKPAKYIKLGARIPHGVLLVGPPGTGKTLLAKAVAGEAGVPFFSISGSDFIELYVGVGASRVRDLFNTAKKYPASIVFIDEIDAVGRHRGTGLGGGHDEREQTLNQLLVEMDGFDKSETVIVMAATNRPDVLDPALLRAGRFDRQITVNYPDIKGREEILHVHAKGKPFEETVDFHKIAQTTVGFTGADLENLLNESALLAARRGKSLIGTDEIEDSYMKLIVGPQKKSKVRSQKDNILTAYHEAGHAVTAYYCPEANPVKHITIVPAGRTGGVTVMIPENDKSCESRNQMLDEITVALGGRVAEELKLDDISTGASADIKSATSTARAMVKKYGMSDRLGPVLYGSEHASDEVFLGRDYGSGQDYSEKTASIIDEEIKAIIDISYERCRNILSEHSDKLEKLAQYLLRVETVDGDQFMLLMDGDPSFEELDEIAENKRRKSTEENEVRRAENEESERLEKELQREEEQHRFDDMFDSKVENSDSEPLNTSGSNEKGNDPDNE